MKNNIYPCIHIHKATETAAQFYCEAFPESIVESKSPYVVELSIKGQTLLLLDEGPSGHPGTAISFMVISDTAEQTEALYKKLVEEGSVLMPLNNYSWSPMYAWISDKFGVNWQLYTGKKSENGQYICPTLMFSGKNAGKTAESLHFYTSLFTNSRIEGILNYSDEDAEQASFVKHAQFNIDGYILMAMDTSTAQGENFNDGVSLTVLCDTQAEIDRYWEALALNGGKEIACGWLVDKFGVSWQIVPSVLPKMMKNPDKAMQVMQAFMKMKKLIIADLSKAYQA